MYFTAVGRPPKVEPWLNIKYLALDKFISIRHSVVHSAFQSLIAITWKNSEKLGSSKDSA